MLVTWGVHPSNFTCILEASIWIDCTIFVHNEDTSLTEDGLARIVYVCSASLAARADQCLDFVLD